MIEARLLRVIFTKQAFGENERDNCRGFISLPDDIELGCRIRSAILSQMRRAIMANMDFFKRRMKP